MARTKNPELTEKIISVLKNHPEGTYVSEIARELKLSKSTVSYVINTRLKNKIKDVKVIKGGMFRLLRLR
jgi:DNA-binding NarL/FixJ family response regulator